MDPGKVTIMTSALGLTGPEAAEILRREKIAVELVDEDHVLFLVTYADDQAEFAKKAVLIRNVGKKPETGTEFSTSGCPFKDSGTAPPTAGCLFCAS